MKSDFSTMTKAELRAYAIAHPDGRTAFYEFVDRFTSEASPETFSMPRTQAEVEEVTRLIEQKVQQMRANN